MADFSITGEVRLNSDPAEKSTSKWTVAAGNMIADFAKKAASELGKVVQSGVDYNASMESYLTNFKVMLGNEELAAAKLSELRKMAASTPFALSDLTEGTQTLLQFGVAADDTTGVLQQLGDISLGNANKLQTLVRAYGKMSSAQKVTLENVNMMIDAGFNPLNQRHRWAISPFGQCADLGACNADQPAATWSTPEGITLKRSRWKTLT